MAVTLATVKLWELPIACAIEIEEQRTAIDGINAALRHTAFVARSDANQGRPFLRFDRVTAGKCTIGYLGESERTVAYRPDSGLATVTESHYISTLTHELGHCLGLAHEQCHADYAWDYAEKIRNRYETLEPTIAGNKAIFDHFTQTPGKGIYAMKMQAVALERKEGRYRDLTARCDYDSIMMYKIFWEAAKAAKAARSPKAVENDPTTATGPHGVLSEGDCVGLRTLYGLT